MSPRDGSGRPNVVVIGHGMVGNKVAESLWRLGATRTMDVTVIGDEPVGGYDRVHLSSLFAGASPGELSLLDREMTEDPAITILAGDRVASIDRVAHAVTTGSGRRIPYRVAVLATGSYAFVPPVPGRNLPGCFVYRSLDDVDRIREWAKGRAHGVVVGGGLLGLEAANALRSSGLATEVVEFAPRLMPAQVDDAGGALLASRIENLGVAVHTATALLAVHPGDDGSVAAVELAPVADRDNRARLGTEMVVFAAGIRPHDDLARSAGIAVGDRGGIVVDRQCRTSDPDVFAVGECALAGGRLHGLVSPGYQMARVAAETICGGDAAFEVADTPTKLKLLGVDVASFGDAHAVGEGTATISFTDTAGMVHKRLVTDADGRLVGGVLVGDAGAFDALTAIAAGNAEAPGDLGGLIAPEGPDGQVSVGGGVTALKDAATICSCENVDKGTICSSIEAAIAADGAADVGAVKAATRAGTGCGGCVPQLAELVRAGLAAGGIATVDRLCEHFALSRQEMFDVVRVGGITTFSELLAAHGTGAGCEVCKPTAASILASVTDRYVLDGPDTALQDTNDHLLANLQKDGTYSVVPRVPGGEITPQRLIVLGQVATDFGLYVKITGGQRIDLLGARIDDLPRIWARLIDAGFESGHAYGKALRTVKSCVGSTWCRYGVQDSTSLAIDLELRYRGLRSPHKLKLGVSGCARECAEARAKDVGIIATERGWNLYVGGNGGTRPRHAELLAEDLDDETLVRYVDRFVMFYVRTADRLQRTSTWMEAMDGGLDHVRDVVVHDSLGLAAELEADMAAHVERYRCEWAETLADPARLRRFRTFVNSEEPDPDIVMVPERGQVRPAEAWERVELLAARP